jgi:hypothetical protein
MTVTVLFPTPAKSQFEAIWKLWPNKSKKLLAKAKYEAILRGCHTRTLDKDSGQFVDLDLASTEDELVAGIKAYLDAQIDRRTYRLKDDGKYIPMLSTFLNGGRYLDLL